MSKVLDTLLEQLAEHISTLPFGEVSPNHVKLLIAATKTAKLRCDCPDTVNPMKRGTRRGSKKKGGKSDK